MRQLTKYAFTGLCSAWVARGLLILLVLGVGGCGANAPYQEMLDARQAIAAAKEAGADQLAAEDFHAAEALLESAERNHRERAYTYARRDAIQAKAKAQDALNTIEHSNDENH